MKTTSLNILESVPPALLDCTARTLADILPAPTLIHLEGRRTDPVFISILLHGNETVGLWAVQRILQKYRAGLPRSLSIFIGNIEATRAGVRRLPEQPDFNRIWPVPGTKPATPEEEMVRQVVNEMGLRKPFVSIDLHNNTGLNPHYACINRLDDRFFHLATLFSRTVVYFLRPEGVQSMAMAGICPAVTLECGRINDESGVDHAAEFIDACLNMEHLPEHPIRHEDIQLFHTVATVKIPADVSFGFGDPLCDIRLVDDLEYFNFHELPAGTVLGHYRETTEPRLDVVNEEGTPVEQRFLHYDNGEIRLATGIMPSMLTLDERVIRQDCLCYFMERFPLPDQSG